jgi:hypothetical protein
MRIYLAFTKLILEDKSKKKNSFKNIFLKIYNYNKKIPMKFKEIDVFICFYSIILFKSLGQISRDYTNKPLIYSNSDDVLNYIIDNFNKLYIFLFSEILENESDFRKLNFFLISILTEFNIINVNVKIIKNKSIKY